MTHLPCTILAGVTYIQWGKTTCPNITGTQLVYSGKAGGTFWSVQGGGAEKLCLPQQPEYLPNMANIAQAIPSSPHVHGAEYSNSNTFQHNVPCAVCYATARSSTLMFPAQIQCPPTWTREYYGYLSSERSNEPVNRPRLSAHFRSSFNCVDVNPEVIENSDANGEGALFYYALSACNSNGLSCPPYENGRILSCVVCTK